MNADIVEERREGARARADDVSNRILEGESKTQSAHHPAETESVGLQYRPHGDEVGYDANCAGRDGAKRDADPRTIACLRQRRRDDDRDRKHLPLREIDDAGDVERKRERQSQKTVDRPYRHSAENKLKHPRLLLLPRPVRSDESRHSL